MNNYIFHKNYIDDTFNDVNCNFRGSLFTLSSDIREYMGFKNNQVIYKWERGDSMLELANLIRLMELFKIKDIRDIIVVTGSDEETLPVF